MRYSIVRQSHIGARTENQDRVGYLERDNAVLLAVADGLSGYEGGELAAQTLVDTFLESFEMIRKPVISDPAAFLVLTVYHAHTAIIKASQRHHLDATLPRTTCVVCLVQNGLAYWAHVGDSRLYLFRNGSQSIRTLDHSISEELVTQGIIDETQSPNEFGQLTRCVGGKKTPHVTLGPETRLQTDDLLLLCSDGVWRGATTQKMITYASLHDLNDGLEQLFDHAKRKQRRTCDNLSALLFRWEGEETNNRPLYNLSVPRIDQDALRSQLHLGVKGAAVSRAAQDQNDFDTTIEELESFVNDIDDLL